MTSTTHYHFTVFGDNGSFTAYPGVVQLHEAEKLGKLSCGYGLTPDEAIADLLRNIGKTSKQIGKAIRIVRSFVDELVELDGVSYTGITRRMGYADDGHKQVVVTIHGWKPNIVGENIKGYAIWHDIFVELDETPSVEYASE